MSDPSKRSLEKQHSLSYVEQSLRLISPPRQAPVTIYPGPNNKISNLSKADLEIANRLEKLRRSSTDLPSEEEMASRLAQLKGLPSDYYAKPTKMYHPPENRTQPQQADDLLNQIMEEVSLEKKTHNKSSSSSGDDEELVKRLSNPNQTFAHSGHHDAASAAPMGFHLPGAHGSYPPQSSNLGIDNLNINEVDEVMRAAERENQAAKKALDAAKRDKSPSRIKSRRHKHKLKKEHKKQKKNKDKEDQDPEKRRRRKLLKKDKKVKAVDGEGGDESSSGEYLSDSDSSDSEAKPKRHGASAASKKEAKEVDRIVKMYTEPSAAHATGSHRTHAKKKDVEGTSEEDEDSTSTDSESITDSEYSDSDDLAVAKQH